MKLLTRDEFREGVFKRDNHKCVICNQPAVDAHHIIDRKLFDNGGYYLDNGASLCESDHIKAERCIISPDYIRKMAGIKTVVLPPDFDPDNIYDKWGKPLLDFVKYPRTPHLPWSEKATDDDKKLNGIEHFIGKRVIGSVKMDGENTSMYPNKIHARSINSDNHPSRDWVKGMWSTIAYQIPAGWRICGENMYALHTIPYNNLTTYFYVFSIWDGNRCLPWDETVEWCNLLGLIHVPVVYDGIFDETKIKALYNPLYDGNPMEGYVIRLADEYQYDDFEKSIAKFVSNNFKIVEGKHWMSGKVIPNKLI
jgi:hypothetical protein